MRISDWSSDVCSSDLLDREAGGEAVLAGAEFAEAVGGEAAGDPPRLAGGDQVEQASRHDRTDHLCDEIGYDMVVGAPSSRPQDDGDGRVEVAARYVADRIGQGEERQPQGERHADEPAARKRHTAD